ncbi:MAG: hypothetical protein ACLVG8_08335 [Bifidobacterium longum]
MIEVHCDVQLWLNDGAVNLIRVVMWRVYLAIGVQWISPNIDDYGVGMIKTVIDRDVAVYLVVVHHLRFVKLRIGD